jgi:hypothetical protein
MATPSPKPSIADTFSRLLRLNVGAGPPRVSRAQLVVASEHELARVARHGSGQQRKVAATLVGSPLEYRKWEAEHGRLMTTVAMPATGERQARELLSAALSLVHRKALFEYLHNQARRGTDRRALIQHFHGSKGFSQAVVSEHSNFLRSVASLLCIEHLGCTLLIHQGFDEPLRKYEGLYAEYFRSYCDSLLKPADTKDDSDSMRMLLPYLKRDVLDERKRLLALPSTNPAHAGR